MSDATANSAANSTEGQLENVAALILRTSQPHTAQHAAPLATRLSTLCSDVALVGDGFPEDIAGRRIDTADRDELLSRVAAGLRGTTAERVLIVADVLPPSEVELLLALIAWPEADVVLPRTQDGRRHPLCAIYRRDRALQAATEALASNATELESWLSQLEVNELAGPDLAAVLPDESKLH